jgi:hypothetical protein
MSRVVITSWAGAATRIRRFTSMRVSRGAGRESGDVIWVVLIADDPDDFAAIVLKALSENLDQKVGDIFSTARLGKELRGDQGAHLAYSSYIPLFAFPDYARC